MEFHFFSIQVIESQLCLWNLSKILKKYLKNWFPLFLIINCGENRDI